MGRDVKEQSDGLTASYSYENSCCAYCRHIKPVTVESDYYTQKNKIKMDNL